MAGFGEKKLPDFVTEFPREFIVEDLHGQTAMSKDAAQLCKTYSYPEFDEKFFDAANPLHPDFVPDPVNKAIFDFGVGILIIFGTVAVFFPLIAGVWLGSLMDWSKIWLPVLLFYALVGAIPFYVYYQLMVSKAWRRYASWVYQNAEQKTVTAQRILAHRMHLGIQITYPNGHNEMVYARFYSYDYSRMEKLDTKRSVTMRRDRTVDPAAVILELEDGRRVWCTSTRP